MRLEVDHEKRTVKIPVLDKIVSKDFSLYDFCKLLLDKNYELKINVLHSRIKEVLKDIKIIQQSGIYYLILGEFSVPFNITEPLIKKMFNEWIESREEALFD